MGGKSRSTLSSGIGRALEDVAKVIARHEGRAAIIGGIAVIARGVPRLTRDIDVAIAGQDISAIDLAAELSEAGIVPRITDAVAFAEENQVLLARHSDSGVDIDVSRAWLPFELEALAAASSETLGGVRTSIAQPEDLIIFKAVAWRPQDQQDIERLLALHGSRIDLERVRRHVKELDEALEVNRLRDLDRLIARILNQ
ncbi:MAG TPA: nucleotidyltransferase [Kofleriaceae bacterium]|jgi:predicted nucleotidyltransferase|nr:nucleotidyltransferase [Kofleriaceae bacterium]